MSMSISTPQEARLHFVLRFAYLDLATLDADAWYALQDELVIFLTLGTAQSLTDPQQPGITLPLHRNVRQGFGFEIAGTVRVDLSHATVAIVDEQDFPLPDAEVRSLQEASLEMLREVRTPYLLPPRQWEPLHVQVSHCTLDLQPAVGRGTLRYIRAAPRDAFLFLLSELLTYAAVDHIQRCPVCPTFFYRIGKQKYCSAACTNRANVRLWRHRHEVKRAEADRAHSRYAETKKTEASAKVKVQRRPRKARI